MRPTSNLSCDYYAERVHAWQETREKPQSDKGIVRGSGNVIATQLLATCVYNEQNSAGVGVELGTLCIREIFA